MKFWRYHTSDFCIFKFLWTKDGSFTPTFDLTPGLLSELNAVVGFAFHNIGKVLADPTKSLLDLPFDRKCIFLSCSQPQGTAVIDDAVRLAGRAQGADVLVLDALELACGRFGALGPGGAIVDELYSARHTIDGSRAIGSTEGASLHDTTLRFLDALLFAQPSSLGGVSIPPLRRRVIYLRNAQLLENHYKPLLTYIILSLYRPPTQTYPPEPYPPIRPTILLVFGTNNAPVYKLGACLFQDLPSLSSLFTFAHFSVRCFGEMRQECARPGAGKRENHLRFQSIENVFDLDLGKKVDELMEGSLHMPIFTSTVWNRATEESWQKDVERHALRVLNRALFCACLQQNEDIRADYPHTEVPLHLIPGTHPLGPADGMRVAIIAAGLAEIGASSQDTSKGFEEYVEQAFKIYGSSEQERSLFEGKLALDRHSPQEELNTFLDKAAGSSPIDKVLVGLSQHARSLKGCIVDIESIPTTFEDVFVDPATIESLQTIVSLPLLYPSYFNTGILAKEYIGGILLHGPPGTGKTMLCRALATSSHASMLQIRPQDINDKYIGESEKRVAGVFELAYKLSPCIIFIDEIDALFSRRRDDTKNWERNILTEFMQCMDGLRSSQKNRDDRIVVVGATNRISDLDPAILRRMSRKILVDLPSLRRRKDILTSYLQDEELDPAVNIEELARLTEGWSGSDLKNLCVAAASLP